MFRPRESYDQRVLSSDVVITPRPVQLRYVQDVFGNCVGIASFGGGRADELNFESRVRLDHIPSPAFLDSDGDVEASLGAAPFAYGADDLPDLQLSMQRLYPDPEGALERWARRFVRPLGRTPVRRLLTEMTGAIHAEFAYRSRLEGEARLPSETLRLREGSCRDFALLMIEAVRSLGLAARFVSGYVHTPSRAPGRSDTQRPSEEGGSGHTHAWVRVYLPACGWVEFDPTNGIVGNTNLIRVAIARDPRQAVPLHGSFKGFASDCLSMDVEVSVDSEDGRIAATSPKRRAAAAA